MNTSWARWPAIGGGPYRPGLPPPAPPAGAGDFPRTYQPVAVSAGVRQEPIFDPALKHYFRAFRAGEPLFDDEPTALRWRAARRAVMDHLLARLADSPWQENLVLRGSVLLRAWFGDRAREPGDLDWVVLPHTAAPDGPLAAELFAGVREAVRAHPRVTSSAPGTPAEVLLLPDRVTTDEIWTYERAEGRRLVLPWRAEGLPPGTVQMDFVFGERLPEPPEVCLVPAADPEREPALVLGAGRGLSLAWKLLWLVGDSYPQGKDLYDAVLLAEHTTLEPELLRRVLEPAYPDVPREVGPETVVALTGVEWAEFQAEYPDVPGTARDWQHRLADALRSALDRAGS
ncbi:nucleotidyl transferase AbiEii/AbiGii toxin family protein [Allostreptomyces psammosilenae]|uniref:Nucleotidyl transferase AbiEii/AbiGii toxin family protein n=1 Tax=Allostreptomyces psammosilenae TaxID=1892865 RepID=A0A852ZNT6_9ACTN|nr:nucleotidyl transferase AbiEii/AbiGii toxin family protein [Allostreptomyces psammosilenae]NYI04116.1 hypothetical protein [Allostreptomyces psammosilenae]